MAAYDRIKGSITALITPFKDGKVDESAYVRFIEWQIAEGTHGLVPCGTTGESPTITYAEQERAIAVCVETARGRVPVIAGAGANDTARAVDLTRHAKRCGADAGRIVSPLRRRRRSRRHSGHRLQRAVAHSRGYFARDIGAAVEDRQHRRHQGRDRQSRARQPRGTRGAEDGRWP